MVRHPLAHGLPLLEILVGLHLLLGLFTKVSAWAANTLLLVFVPALLQGALRGLQIDCGCFGTAAGESESLWLALLSDLGFLTPGLQLAYGGSGRFGLEARLRFGTPRQSLVRDRR